MHLRVQDGAADIRVMTNWVESGFDHPVPRELWIDVRLWASSIDEAIERARSVAPFVASVAAFATNAEVGDMKPHLAFETTLGVTEREFVEYFLPDERGLVSQGRYADPEIVTETARAVLASSQWKGVSIALAHYFSALTHYHTGGEALAVAHLFMSAEALREPTLRNHCAETGDAEIKIMEAEGHETRGHLLAWVRRELIFAGDRAVHRAAKEASDGLEHGFKTVADVRALATKVCDETFRYVRTAIVNLLDVQDSARQSLLTTFGKPADAKSLYRRVTGVLVGEGDELAQPDRAYPVLEWNSSIASFALDDDGVPDARFTDRFTVRTADAIAVKLHRMEVYGRSRSGSEAREVDMQVVPANQGREKDEVLPFMRQVATAGVALGGSEAAREYSAPLAQLLILFNQIKGLYRAALILLEADHPDESMIIGRAIVTNAARLHEAAISDEPTRDALAFGWRRDSVIEAARIAAEWAARPAEEAESAGRLEAALAQIRSAADRFGVGDLRAFAVADKGLHVLDDDDYQNIDRLAGAIQHGWDVAAQSRMRRHEDGTVGLHDTAPDSWVYPLAAKFIGGGYLIAIRAARELFSWSDPEDRLYEAEEALQTLEDELEHRPTIEDG